MRKLLVLLLVLVLAACAAPPVTPTQPPTEEVMQPTQTAAVIIQTVIVTVVPTDLPTETPTQVPTATATPLPPPTEVPATQPPATEQSAATARPAQAADASGPVTLDNALSGGWFKDMTLTAKALSLRCQASKQITFTLTPADPSITQADFYYRIEDRATGAVFDWQGPRRMTADANGNLTLVFTGEDVNPNFRKPNAWFDFQVVGLNKSGGRVGSTEKVVQQVSYTFDCP